MARKITTEIFIKESEERFGKGVFDFSKTIYKGSAEKVCIICPKHGEFWVLPGNFKNYVYGCPKCSRESKITTEEFIKRSKSKFNDKFDYSKTEYTAKNNKVILICPIHGEFEIKPENHLNSPTGCQMCSKDNSRKKLVDNKDRKQMREYSIWKGMKTRVTNLNTREGVHYILDKGITCCEEWLNSFEQFYKDIGPCPDGYSLDRIDNNGNYCPENCRWASSTTQSQNRGEFNLIFTHNGETHVLKEWARIVNIKYGTLYNRIYRDGLSFEDAIKEDPYERLFEFKGQKKTLKDWCEIYNIKYQTVVNRLHKHQWTLEEALLTPYKHKKIQI